VTARREASCSCGQLRLVAHDEPVLVTMCHCFACQRRTGSAFRFKGCIGAIRSRHVDLSASTCASPRAAMIGGIASAPAVAPPSSSPPLRSRTSSAYQPAPLLIRPSLRHRFLFTSHDDILGSAFLIRSSTEIERSRDDALELVARKRDPEARHHPRTHAASAIQVERLARYRIERVADTLHKKPLCGAF
jgi:hypothetical protein